MGYDGVLPRAAIHYIARAFSSARTPASRDAPVGISCAPRRPDGTRRRPASRIAERGASQ